MTVGKKYIGSLNKVIGKYCDELLADFPDPDLDHVFITHSSPMPEVQKVLKDKLKERGFNPSVTRGGIDIVVNINNVFTGIAILFSNSSLNEILNYYRTTKTEYKKYGWDVVFANVMTYSRGLNYLTDNICKQLNKKLPKKERSKKK